MALLLFEPFRIAADKTSFASVRKVFEDEVGVRSILPGYEPFTEYTLGFRTIDECSVFPSEDLAREKFARSQHLKGYRFVRTVQWKPSDEVTGLAVGSKRKQQAADEVTKGALVEQPQQQTAEEAEQARIKAREQRKAEFEAKLAAHEASVAEYQRKVAEREAEIARQKEELAANKEAAARKLAEHQREMAEANRRQQEYNAARRRHMQCLSWDKKACDDIIAGKPALEEKLADAGKASTDTDATTCVSRPVVAPTPGMKGSLAATVVNGCEAAVDVRVCLTREGGWNCGAIWGLKPQDRWSHSSFKSSGEIFWDARVSGSSKPLASPGGN